MNINICMKFHSSSFNLLVQSVTLSLINCITFAASLKLCDDIYSMLTIASSNAYLARLKA